MRTRHENNTTSFAELAAANGQIELERLLLGKSDADDKPSAQAAQVAKPSKGAELLAAVREQKRERGVSSDWVYGTGPTRIVFMDNRAPQYKYAPSRPNDWATAAPFGEPWWYPPYADAQAHQKASKPKYAAALAKYSWIDPFQPRNYEQLIQNLDDADGLFCHEVLHGTDAYDLQRIALNFAQIIQRPVGWHFEGNIPISTIRGRRSNFEGAKVTFYDNGESLEDAVRQFAESLAASAKLLTL